MSILELENLVSRQEPIAERSSPWMVGAPLPDEVFDAVRRRMLLEHCKWDPQVGDVSTLASFPLILRAGSWRALAKMAEDLAAETLTAEEELIFRPDLLKRIGLPRRVRHALQQAAEFGLTKAATRVMRFDFHLTTEGWRISEVNSDVPGGFTEASSFTQMVAAHCGAAAPMGDPLGDWCRAIARVAGENGTVGLLTAPGFMEDHQITSYLAKHLDGLGCKTHLANPLQLEWRGGIAFLNSAWHTGPLDALVRFYQGEWISNLPTKYGWHHFFCGGQTPVGNPGYAIISESKRFPLAWAEMETRLPNWQKLLPETRDPSEVSWETDETWLVKSALCNTGDTVSIRSELNRKKWETIVREVKRRPEEWVAQRRFQSATLRTPMGMMYPCIGVYTIDGMASGVYARMGARPVIDFEALDTACLVEASNSTQGQLGAKIEHEQGIYL